MAVATRLMTCEPCGHAWETPAVAPAGTFQCPECGAHVCACGCGAHLGDMRADARYDSAACRTALERGGWGSTRAAKAHVAQTGGTVHPLREARERQEATALDKRLGQVIHQAIVALIVETGSAHADDLEPFYPTGHGDRCRELQPGRFGSLRSRGYIIKRDERKSRVKSRNGAKSGVYEFTKKGRERLVGVGGGVVDQRRSSGASPHSGETSSPNTGKGPAHSNGATLDRPASSQGDSPAGARLLDDGVKGSSAAPHEAVGEPTALPGLEEKPRSAWTDPELGEAA